MSGPSITSITFDKETYTSGEAITATVAYTPGTTSKPSVQVLTGTVTDSVSGQSGKLEVTFTVDNVSPDATVVTVSDSGNRAWSKQSDNGSVAVFTAVA